MNKFKTFFSTFFKSISEPSYYNDVVASKFSFSVKYFLVFYLLIAIITSVNFNFRTKPQLQNIGQDAISQLTQSYPESLTLTVAGGQLEVNGLDEPINVPFPDYATEIKSSGNYDYLATINTTEEFPREKSLLVFTKTNLIMRRPDGRKELIPFSEIGEDFVIDKNAVGLTTSTIQTTLDTIVRYSPYAILIGAIIILPLLATVTLLIYSLFTWLTGSIIKKNLSYKKSFQIGLHTITFAETVNTLQDLLFPGFTYSGLFSLAFFGSTLIALHSLKPQPKTK